MEFHYEDIGGLVPPLVTPMRRDKSVDPEGVDRLVNHVIGSGKTQNVDGVFICGLTGEGPWLNDKQSHDMFNATVESVKGRVPVLFGALGRTAEEAEMLARYGAENGADAIVVAPMMFLDYNQQVFTWVAKAAASVNVPVYAYTNPALANLRERPANAHLRISPATFEELLDIPTFMGIKCSGLRDGEIGNYCGATREHDARVFVGDEESMIWFEHVVPSYANLDPKVCRDLQTERDFYSPIGRRLQDYIIESGTVVYAGRKKHRPGLKTALSHLGICKPFFVEPAADLNEKEERAIEQHVDKLVEEGLYQRAG